MRIGIFTDQYFPTVSGVVTSIETLADGLRARGHIVYIITSLDLRNIKKEELEILKAKGEYFINVPGFHYPFKKLRGYRFINIKKEYIKRIALLKLDVIHVQTEFSMAKLAIKCSKKLNIPMVHTFHTLFDEYLSYVSGFFTRLFPKMMHNILVNRFLRPVSRQSLIEIVPTKKVYDQRYHYKLGINEDVRIIPTGINLDAFLESKRQASLVSKYQLQDKFVYLFVGRISEEKRISNIITAYKKVANANNRLLIVGDGPELSKLRKLTLELELKENVIFTGFIEWKNISSYYALGDVFLCDSVSETQGLTYLEALASGLPLLVRKDDCLLKLLINDYNGIAYEKENELIAYMKNLETDKNKLLSLKRNTKKSTIQYTDNIFVENIIKVYEDVIKK